jgi:malate dehydrogenase (oxaloacetate-decarboxylating)(NADP+)
VQKVRRKDALEYHRRGRPGKIEVVATKPLTSQRDLALAYSPGVAEPCLAIAADPSAAYHYTARGNLVAVITNGTAVLGLGDIGPLASKPVMEGKAVLFKRFADIDVFDLEIAENDPDKFVEIVAALEPTFGAINLEDIKAPESFAIEDALKQRMGIPVFHDDQHGTAIIAGAALLNAAELQGKALAELRVVVSGAGASAVATTRFFIRLGVQPEHVLMCDSAGVIFAGRTAKMNAIKAEFAVATERRTLAEALAGADVFLGLSSGGLVDAQMLATMAPRPIVFALANPTPEVDYDVAKAARPDAIVATGRSDFPNQVNNVLGFPFIFRGALDVRATGIDESMKVAAARALAELAKRDVPQVVRLAYGHDFRYGPEYVIPKPFDSRALLYVAPAVAEAAIAAGLSRLEGPFDVESYREHLQGLLGPSAAVLRKFVRKASAAPKKIAFPEGDDPRVLEAAAVLVDEGIAAPVLLGDRATMRAIVAEQELDLDVDALEVVDPRTDPALAEYVAALVQLRARKGMTARRAATQLAERNAFAMMMLRAGRADGVVTGANFAYADAVRPALQIVGLAPGRRRAVGMYLLLHRSGLLFFADTTINVELDAEGLAEVAELVADAAATYDVVPKVALLSASNFGSVEHPSAAKVAAAVALLRARRPDLEVEGEMQADVAVAPDLRRRVFPFSRLDGAANVFVFPNLDAGNAAYKLLRELGDVPAVGPILLGMAKPVTVLERDAKVADIIHMAALTALQVRPRGATVDVF